MARSVDMSRDVAEQLVDLLEANWNANWQTDPGGRGVEYAEYLREQFGMPRAPRLMAKQGGQELSENRYTMMPDGHIKVEPWKDVIDAAPRV